MFKVICVDNFNRDSHNHPDRNLTSIPLSEPICEQIRDLLNAREHERSDRYWRCVPWDHKLRTFAPDYDPDDGETPEPTEQERAEIIEATTRGQS